MIRKQDCPHLPAIYWGEHVLLYRHHARGVCCLGRVSHGPPSFCLFGDRTCRAETMNFHPFNLHFHLAVPSRVICGTYKALVLSLCSRHVFAAQHRCSFWHICLTFLLLPDLSLGCCASSGPSRLLGKPHVVVTHASGPAVEEVLQ